MTEIVPRWFGSTDYRWYGPLAPEPPPEPTPPDPPPDPQPSPVGSALGLVWDLESEVPALDANALHLVWAVLEDLPSFDPTPLVIEVDDVPIKAAILPSATAAQNQSAINAAIAAAKTAGRGAVYLPGGQYDVQCPIFATVDNLRVYGDGVGVTVLNMVRQNTSNVVEQWRLIGSTITVEDIEFREKNPVATRAEHNLYPGMTGLRLGGSSPATLNDTAIVRNCKFLNTYGQAIVAYYTQRALVAGNIVQNVGEAIAIENCVQEAIVVDNNVTDTSDDQIIIKRASDSGRYTSPTQRAVIANNLVKQGDAKGIIAEGVQNCVVANNVVRDHNQFGIAVHNDPGYPDLLPPSRVVVANNVVQRGGGWYGTDNTKYLYTAPNNAASGVKVEGPGFVTVEGNLVTESYGPAINCEGAGSWTDVAIIGNKVNFAYGIGIMAGDPDKLTFKHRNIRVQNNDVSQTITGIQMGECDIFSCTGNVVRSYRNGASGARRGILIGHSQRGQVTGNTVVNDDGGDAQIYLYNGCLNVTSTPNVTL